VPCGPAGLCYLSASDPLGWTFGARALIFLAALLVGARNLHETLDRSIRLGLEQARLADSLERAREAAEAALTERREAGDKLKLAASVFANSQEGIIITATDGRIIDVNQVFNRITGFATEEAIGLGMFQFRSERHPPDFFDAMRLALDQKGGWQGEVWNRRKDGEEYPTWFSIAAVKNPDGAVTHYVCTFTDISQRRAAEEEIRKLAFFDPLTGLPNRRLLTDRLNHARAVCARRERLGALLFIDLDNFKTLNDTLGHDKGETCCWKRWPSAWWAACARATRWPGSAATSSSSCWKG
jgi:PAS domain S-box-containing protein